MPPSNPSLGAVPKSISHTLPGLAMDDLIDSTQSSDLQTNRLLQLEKGVTATKTWTLCRWQITPAGDRRYSWQWRLAGKIAPSPVLHSYGRATWNGLRSEGKPSDGSLPASTNQEVLKINFCDKSSVLPCAVFFFFLSCECLRAVGASEMESLFRGFPDFAFTPQFNLGWKRWDDRQSD